METTFKTRAIKAVSWSFVQEFAQRGLQLLISILLARLLGPSDFGLVAMLTIFIAVGVALAESGFGAALIQRKDISQIDECSVFYFNIGISILLAGVLSLGAPLIAEFFRQPTLTPLTRLWSIVLIINSFCVVQSALLARELKFKAQAIVMVASTGASGIIGICLALSGWGVWSLAWQQITFAVTRAALLWTLSKWRPRPIFSLAALRELFGFGAGVLGSSIIGTVFENVYTLVIGRVFSPATLGFYNRAFTLQETASRLLASIANRVTFPIFSQLQDDRSRMKRAMQKAMITLAFAQFPMMIGLAAVTEPLVLALLGDKWAESIPYLRLLCFAGLLYPMHLLNLNVLMANGRADRFFYLVLTHRLFVIVNVLVTYRWSVLAMVWGQVLVSVLSFFVNSIYSKRMIHYSVYEQLRDVSPYLAAAAVMGAAVALFNPPFPMHPALLLAFKILIGALIYLGVCFASRLVAFQEMMSILRLRLQASANA